MPFFFYAFEIFVISVFTVEYFLRIWTVTLSPEYRRPIRGRVSFMATPFGIIDLLSFLPFYLIPFIPLNLFSFRFFQILRVLRVLKISHYVPYWQVFVKVFQAKKNELKVIGFIILFLLVTSSSIMYFLEYPYQPLRFSSIPATMWWAIVTMTTVGYGDLVPITITGKILAGLLALSGLLMFVLPTALLGSGFIDEILTQSADGLKRCPHCKKSLLPPKKRFKTWLAKLFSRYRS
jgi:voltage-gated potassium channel